MTVWQRLLVAAMPGKESRIKYIYKHKIFREIGKDCIFAPRILPQEPEYIKLHDNVVVAARVTFITHDIIHKMLSRRYGGKLRYYHGCIEVGNNVFIGSNSTILPDVKIGDDCVIAAGSVVTKDLPAGGVYAGVPAKRIGDTDKLYASRKKESSKMRYDPDSCWEKFDRDRSL